MQTLITVILPVFLVIGFGYLAAWRNLFTQDNVDGLMRSPQFLQQLLPVVLSHAAHDAEGEVGVVLLAGSQVARLAQGLLFGLVPYAASV